MARHFTLPPRAALGARVPRVLHSVSHLLCAVLALGSATCNTKNSMFVTPVSTRVARAIVARTGVGITCNIRMVWRTNIADFPRIFANSARNAQTFHPGSTIHIYMYIFAHDNNYTSIVCTYWRTRDLTVLLKLVRIVDRFVHLAITSGALGTTIK